MVDSDKREFPASFRTLLSAGFLAPAPSFQRACERRPLFYLDDPQLQQSAAGLAAGLAPAQPFISIRASITGSTFDPSSVEVVTEQRGPRFETFGPLRVQGLDSDESLITEARRGDLRVRLTHGFGAQSTPQGAPVWFAIDIVESMRRARVVSADGSVLLDLDLGPTLVAACANGALSLDLCATFDSDGDGCRDVADDAPLVPEAEPPTINGTITPSLLWPPNRKLRDVSVALELADNCTPQPEVVLESIVSSQAESINPGDPSPDIADASYGTADFAFRLRAERLAPKGSRTYTVTYRATDRAGNTSRLSLDVVVPHDRGGL
jgi:hypothetical protein